MGSSSVPRGSTELASVAGGLGIRENASILLAFWPRALCIKLSPDTLGQHHHWSLLTMVTDVVAAGHVDCPAPASPGSGIHVFGADNVRAVPLFGPVCTD